MSELSGRPSPPRVVLVTGVSGSGKSTVARSLAERLAWVFVEGDDLHSAANLAKMSSGTALTDHDRGPWLDALAEHIDEHLRSDRPAVYACSALTRRYRDRLVLSAQVRVIQLISAPDELGRRMRYRRGHFMPTSLLNSQLALLEPLEPDEHGLVAAADDSLATMTDDLLARLGLAPSAEPDRS